jgi:hypothetical protein
MSNPKRSHNMEHADIMENKRSDSCTSQDDEKKGEVSSLLIDRASRAKLMRLQAGSIAATQHAEGEARLGTARAYDVHRHFASSSFPPELRLLVMRAGVLQHAPCWHVGPKTTMDDLKEAAFSCLLPSSLWCPQVSRFVFDRLDDQMRSILTDTAQRAFLENTIFKIDAVDRKMGDILRELRFEVPPLLKDVGPFVHNLAMTIRVSVGGSNKPQNCNHAWAAIQDIKWLKFHLPNLKSCVLTLELGLPMLTGDKPEVPAFDRRFLQTPCNPIMRDPRHDFKTLSDGFARLFEVFADEGPGKSRFVRVRFCSDAHDFAVLLGWDDTDVFSYGPLVRAERIGKDDASLGARLVEAAYRLVRADSPLPLEEQPKHEPYWWENLFPLLADATVATGRI